MLSTIFLSVFEAIYVFVDEWILGPPSEGGQEEGDYVGGLKAAAADLEVHKKVAGGHLVVEGLLFFQWEKPGVVYDGDEERASGALNCFDEPLKLNLCRPQALGLGGGDAAVVGGERNRHALECRAVAVV